MWACKRKLYYTVIDYIYRSFIVKALDHKNLNVYSYIAMCSLMMNLCSHDFLIGLCLLRQRWKYNNAGANDYSNNSIKPNYLEVQNTYVLLNPLVIYKLKMLLQSLKHVNLDLCM